MWWRHGAVSVALVAVAVVLSLWTLRDGFDDELRCRYLIVERVSAPEFMCEGADLGASTGVAGAVDSAADAMGLSDEDDPLIGDALTVPGLAALVDGPLDVVRQIGLTVAIVVIAAISATIAWIVRNVPRVVALLRFDGDAWTRAAARSRLFLAIFVALLTPFWLVAIT